MSVRYRYRGFTLIELLVVIAIIGVLVGLLLPAVQQAREAARRMTCVNNLKQTGLAMHSYYDSNRQLPSGYISPGTSAADPSASETAKGYAWGFVLLPYMEQSSLFDSIDQTGEAVGTSNEAKAAEANLGGYRCPTDTAPVSFSVNNGSGTVDLPTSNYVAVLGWNNVTTEAGQGNGVFFRNSDIQFRDIRDGLSTTICVGERKHIHDFFDQGPYPANSTWYAAVPGVLRNAGMTMMPMMKEGPGSLVLGHVGQSGMMSGKTPNHTNHIVHFSSSHFGGVAFLLCDGSTHIIRDNIDYQLFKAIGTRAGGEVTNL
jgi:prepilin-type N-terminal cleavage/methylation domain-containing protein